MDIAESRGMEDSGTGDYREARMKKGQGNPRKVTDVQQNKLLYKAEIHGSHPCGIRRLPWNLLAHHASPSCSAVAPRISSCCINHRWISAAVRYHTGAQAVRGTPNRDAPCCQMIGGGKIKFPHWKILPGCCSENIPSSPLQTWCMCTCG